MLLTNQSLFGSTDPNHFLCTQLWHVLSPAVAAATPKCPLSLGPCTMCAMPRGGQQSCLLAETPARQQPACGTRIPFDGAAVVQLHTSNILKVAHRTAHKPACCLCCMASFYQVMQCCMLLFCSCFARNQKLTPATFSYFATRIPSSTDHTCYVVKPGHTIQQKPQQTMTAVSAHAVDRLMHAGTAQTRQGLIIHNRCRHAPEQAGC